MQKATPYRCLIQSVTAFLVLIPTQVYGQEDAAQLFRAWARVHAQPITHIDEDSRGNSDLKGLAKIVGDAKVMAVGEPMHGAHEPLAMRNRIIQYAVTEMGVTAVALESGIGTAKLLYDHVLGRTKASNSALRQAFSYGFGGFEENMELVQWLRDYNTSRPVEGKIRLYAFDLTGQAFPYAYRSVEAVLAFLDRADPALATNLRKDYAELVKVFRADQYTKLTQPVKDEITRRIQDLIAILERERAPLIAASSADDYDWALQQAIAASQDDTFLRTLPGDPFELLRSPDRIREHDARWERNAEVREIAMAKNVQWVQRRTAGKVLIFAHNAHVQTQARKLDGVDISKVPYAGWRPAGFYLRSIFGADYVVIASLYGRGEDFYPSMAPRVPEETTMVPSAAAEPRFLLDLRVLPSDGPLRAWFDALHAFPWQSPQHIHDQVSLTRAYEAVIYLGTVTPSRGARKFQEIEVPIEKLREHEGVYRLNDNFALTVRLEGNRLTIHDTGQQAILVFAYEKDRFFCKAVYFQLEFKRDTAGKISSLVLYQNGSQQTAIREAAKP